MRNVILAIIMVIMVSGSGIARINLAGEWNVRLGDESSVHIIQLPGTTDEAGLGVADTLSALLQKPQLLHLTRRNSFIGPATYTRTVDISPDMAGKPLRLTLERVMWRSRLAVDGKDTGQTQESLTTPHIFEIPQGLSAGKHTIELRIDNSKQYDISYNDLAHAYTDDTQIKWNGVLGTMCLDTIPEIEIKDIQVYPDVANSAVKVKVRIDSRLDRPRNVRMDWALDGLDGGTVHIPRIYRAQPGSKEYSFTIADSLLATALWSEFNPQVLTLGVTVAGNHKSVDFGMRNIESRNGRILVNGEPVFLRGTLECCVFPLTGTPPTTEEGWTKVFDTAAEWGLNHLRFHSWCPPEAAFRAADRKGFYLQVECPLWSVEIAPDTLGANGAVKRFIRNEFDRIVQNYGNHPSFCLMTVGNELQSDFDWLNEMTAHMHVTDPRHLYSATSFTFEKGHGGHAEANDDFLVTQWTDKGWARGQGVFNSESPTFNKDYSQSTSELTVPLIEHEIGQYAVYPDLSEIDRYTGVLKPLNFMAVRDDLERKGRLHRAPDYLQASGRLAALLYKEEIERALKTPGTAGIQLLGLQDFPGQGTALIGLVNSFWDSKGIVDPGWFRQFCAPTVPLAFFEKAAWRGDEEFGATLAMANYSQYAGSWTAYWKLTDGSGHILASGECSADSLGKGLTEIDKIKVPLAVVENASKLNLSVEIPQLNAFNSWSLWVYPHAGENVDFGSVKVTRSLDRALEWLSKGEKVLFSPQRDSVAGPHGKFVPVFWSPVHFPKEAGAMGLLCNPDHPALALFPNDGHTDWQWWHSVKNSAYVSLDDFPGAEPIIEMVDNFTTNRPLAVMFEARVGNGRLVMSTIDLLAPDAHFTVTRLLESVVHYMDSDSFSPSGVLEEDALKTIVGR